MVLPGFTRAGGPVIKEELLDAWMRVYATLMITLSRDPETRRRLEELKDLLAQANELVQEIFGEASP